MIPPSMALPGSPFTQTQKDLPSTDCSITFKSLPHHLTQMSPTSICVPSVMAFQKLTAFLFIAGLVTRKYTRGIEFCLQDQKVGVCQAPSLPFSPQTLPGAG